MLPSKVMDVLRFACQLRPGSNPVPSVPFFSSMLSQHFTTRPSWRVLYLFRKLPNVLQVKDLHFSHVKRVVTQEARTSYPRMSPSKVEHVALELSRQTSPYLLFVLVMMVITYSYLVLRCKRTAVSGIRSYDLRSPSPERSHGAIEAD